jgi:hypothetical protein
MDMRQHTGDVLRHMVMIQSLGDPLCPGTFLAHNRSHAQPRFFHSGALVSSRNFRGSSMVDRIQWLSAFLVPQLAELSFSLQLSWATCRGTGLVLDDAQLGLEIVSPPRISPCLTDLLSEPEESVS